MKIFGMILAAWAAAVVVYNLLPKKSENDYLDHPRPFYSGRK
jgi:hypothetical protein